MDTLRICKSCRTPLPPDAPEGICPACLAKAALGTHPTAQPPTANAGVPTPEELRQFFAQMEIVEMLGRGGMGAVYKARQPHLDRFVALKILSPELSRDPAFAERFAREARALARLNHPNIVSVYDFGKAGEFYYLIMEFVDGMNLHEVLSAKKLEPREALHVITEICNALQFAHDEGIVHRDIKPGNILIDRKGRVKIADFGLAKIAGKQPQDFRLTQSQIVLGTPQYMAPEQIERPLEVDHRADIYSLGVVFYEMLTGELPIGRFAPPSAKVQIDVRLDEVVLKALEKEPVRRYQQVSEVRSDVETVASGAQNQTIAAAPASRTSRVSWLKTAGWIGAAVLIAAGLIGGALILKHKKPKRIFYTFAGMTHFERGPEGPQLLQSFARELDLTPMQTAEVNKIVPRYYREFIALERQHTTVTNDARGHVHINIAPFADDTIELAKRMNAEVRGVIGKELLHPDQPGNLMLFGLFRHCGETPMHVQLWKDGKTYHFEEKHGMRHFPGGGMGGGQERGGSGRVWEEVFPEEYWVYWNESGRPLDPRIEARRPPGPRMARAMDGELGPAQILHKMEEKYDSLLSFSAKGKTITHLDHGGEKSAQPIEHTFAIKLARPEYYRIEWSQAVGEAFTNHGAVWNAGAGDFIFTGFGGKASSVLNRELALGTAAGLSGQATLTAPALFFKDKVLGWSGVGRDFTRQPDETIDHDECYVLTSAAQKETLWIAKRDFFLKKVETVHQASPKNNADAFAKMSDEELKKIIKMTGHDISPEEFRKTQQRVFSQFTPQTQSTTTQIFEHIAGDEIMEKEDFAYKVPTTTQAQPR